MHMLHFELGLIVELRVFVGVLSYLWLQQTDGKPEKIKFQYNFKWYFLNRLVGGIVAHWFAGSHCHFQNTAFLLCTDIIWFSLYAAR